MQVENPMMFENVRYLRKMWTTQYSYLLRTAVSCHTLLDKKVSIRAFCLIDKLVYCKVMAGRGRKRTHTRPWPALLLYLLHSTTYTDWLVYKTGQLNQVVHSQFQCQHHGYYVQARKCYISSITAPLCSTLSLKFW